MKKLVSIVMAVILPIVMLTGCSAPLSKSEYKKEVANLVEKYLSIAMIDEDTTEEIMDILEDTEEFDRDARAEIKEIFETEYAKADEYLDKLEKLNPPEEMEDFHNDLLSCIEKARDAEEKFVAAFDAKNLEKYQSAMEKAGSALTKLAEKIEKYSDDDDWEWLFEKLEDFDFENTMMGSMI